MSATKYFSNAGIDPQSKYVLFPIQQKRLWDLYKKHVSFFWTSEEINLKEDVVDWDTRLNPKEKTLLEHILGFFVCMDGIVFENLHVNFVEEVPFPEARCFYGMQGMIENVHAETYSLLIDTLIKDQKEKLTLFHSIKTMEPVGKLTKWAINYLNDEIEFPLRLLAFAMIEGVVFPASFAVIYWFKSRGLMPGLGFSNELIARDENLHYIFAISLYGLIKEEYRVEEALVRAMMSELYLILISFWKEALPSKLPGMNYALMCEYINYKINRFACSLGFETAPCQCPFFFMKNSMIDRKTNFFERKVSEYQVSQKNNEIKFNVDFYLCIKKSCAHFLYLFLCLPIVGPLVNLFLPQVSPTLGPRGFLQ